MTFGPACEHCGANSYEGSDTNPRCPWCKKFKRRGTREGLVEALQYASVGLGALRTWIDEQLEVCDSSGTRQTLEIYRRVADDALKAIESA